jgi:hypothetical protein
MLFPGVEIGENFYEAHWALYVLNSRSPEIVKA